MLSWCCVAMLAVSGCSRQQSDWQKTRETNTADAYEQFLKKYPTGEFTAQAQARVKELYEERDWQKARDADTPEAYQAFLKQYPEGKWTEEARIRVENFTLAQAPSSGTAASAGGTDAATSGPAAAPGVVTGSAPPSAPRGPATSSADEESPPVSNAAPAKPAAARAASSTPAPTSAKTTARGKSAAGANSARSTGSYAIQLGAFKSGPGIAQERWTHLQKQYPTLLGGLSSKVVPKKTGAGHLYRLRSVGLTEKRARSICASLRAKSQVCIVVPPSQG